ncbi:hypothetical protein MVES_003098 [Malassezia vespertilionis]|uniref:Uncharacterized protein n=1 Tax=Malassezia vespertilionis TaxID=2020962 RepID=A0A2N1J9D6_9BASI|nr:hypothetical protein MVES_003098 [Malassezia vespertilionis]
MSRDETQDTWVRDYQEMASGDAKDDAQVQREKLRGPPKYLDDLPTDGLLAAPWGSLAHADKSSDSLTSEERYEREQDMLARREWDEGVRQLQMAFQLVLIPFFGKWLGRRWSYWAFGRWIQ